MVGQVGTPTHGNRSKSFQIPHHGQTFRRKTNSFATVGD